MIYTFLAFAFESPLSGVSGSTDIDCYNGTESFLKLKTKSRLLACAAGCAGMHSRMCVCVCVGGWVVGWGWDRCFIATVGWHCLKAMKS